MIKNPYYSDTLVKKSAQIIEDLSLSKRPLIKMTPDEVEQFSHFFNWAMQENQFTAEVLKNTLCVLAHTYSNHPKLSSTTLILYSLIKKSTLSEAQKEELIIYFLNSVEKQFIDPHTREGRPYPEALIIIMRELLKAESFEIVEWTLRTILIMGPTNRQFESSLIDKKPRLLKIFNPKQMQIFQLIDILRNEWKKNLMN